MKEQLKELIKMYSKVKDARTATANAYSKNNVTHQFIISQANIYDMVITDLTNLLESEEAEGDKPAVKVLVGTLSKRYGQNGYKVAEIGHPVYRLSDRHIIELTSLDGNNTIDVTFYIGDLSVKLNN